MKTYHFLVTGRVQGVGFRWSAQEEARRLNLAGWVSNNEDGSVSGLAQGGEAALESFHQWLNRGPRSAVVQSVEWTAAAPTGLRLFTIR